MGVRPKQLTRKKTWVSESTMVKDNAVRPTQLTNYYCIHDSRANRGLVYIYGNVEFNFVRCVGLRPLFYIRGSKSGLLYCFPRDPALRVRRYADGECGRFCGSSGYNTNCSTLPRTRLCFYNDFYVPTEVV